MESANIYRFAGCWKAAVVLVFSLGLALCLPAAGIGDGTPADTLITRGDLEGMVRHYVRQKAPWPAERLRINRIQISGEARIPPGKPTVEIVAPPNTDFLGTVPLSVQLLVDGSLVKRLWAAVDTSVDATAVVAQKPLGRFAVIRREDVALVRQDLADLPSNVLTDLEQVIGKRTRRSIAAGQSLRSDLVEFPPLVHRGDTVMIVAQGQGLKITAMGLVKQQGHLGERIRVVNLDSDRSVYARVVDARTVSVDF